MRNPLLDSHGLPPFSDIRPEHVEPAIDEILADNRSRIRQILTDNSEYTWDNLMQPLEELNDRLSRAWSPVRHLNSVMNNEDLRKAYNACLPKLSDYATELAQDEDLYRAARSVRERDDFARLSAAQRKAVDNALRDFRLGGVTLDPEDKARFKVISQELSALSAKFEENVLDATNAWSRHITDEAELAGVPESTRRIMAEAATQKALDGYLLTLDFPVFFGVIAYCDNRELRREIYEAFTTRASDTGPHAGRWDNTENMERILALRHEQARLLGFNNYAELSLEPKMASSTDEVMGFLNELAGRAKPAADGEFAELQAFARESDGVDPLQAWDIPYYTEKLRHQRHELSAEDLRPYFPADRVIHGLFRVVERLYGVSIRERTAEVDTWHPDVQFFEIRDSDGSLRGQFYTDLYARGQKRGGAWMDVCRMRKAGPEGLQHPVAYLTCNFTPPAGGEAAQLTHDEVQTLFHEFGHGLHHMLTRVDVPAVSGIAGVPWDAVELPSQFLENWCWNPAALRRISSHYKTGEPLPDSMIEKLQRARNFHSAMHMVRQLEFSLYDMRLHAEYDPARGARHQTLLDEVRREVAVIQPPEFVRFQHGFSHIFAGGYAAGYYSYLWAEVLSADAFSLFEENGVFDPATGRRFLSEILERGGSRNAMASFEAFRGRSPSADALLRHCGLNE
jgi:oligopeptidase A